MSLALCTAPTTPVLLHVSERALARRTTCLTPLYGHWPRTAENARCRQLLPTRARYLSACTALIVHPIHQLYPATLLHPRRTQTPLLHSTALHAGSPRLRFAHSSPPPSPPVDRPSMQQNGPLVTSRESTRWKGNAHTQLSLTVTTYCSQLQNFSCLRSRLNRRRGRLHLHRLPLLERGMRIHDGRNA